MFFSQRTNLNIDGHSSINFVDIRLDTDTKLFIDPSIIETNKDQLSQEADHIISSFFNVFYSHYKNYGISRRQIKKLLSNFHEVNDTKLGYGNGRNGKGRTSHGLLEYFEPLPKLLDDGVPLGRANDILYFIGGIAEDFLSDMITNILFDLLNDFTLSNATELGLSKFIKNYRGYYYWNAGSRNWQRKNGKRLVIDGSPILLVPKQFVCTGFLQNAEHFFRHQVLRQRQEDNTAYLSDGTVIIPTKKAEEEFLLAKNPSKREWNTRSAIDHPHLLERQHNATPTNYATRMMTDDELDRVVYRGR